MALLMTVNALSSSKGKVLRSSTTTKGHYEDPVFLICPGFGNDEMDYINPMERGDGMWFCC